MHVFSNMNWNLQNKKGEAGEILMPVVVPSQKRTFSNTTAGAAGARPWEKQWVTAENNTGKNIPTEALENWASLGKKINAATAAWVKGHRAAKSVTNAKKPG